jgi:hypothetical protein
VAFGPNGRSLLSGSHDHSVRLWVSDTGAEIAVLNGHSAALAAAAFSPAADQIASIGYDDVLIGLKYKRANNLADRRHAYSSGRFPSTGSVVCDEPVDGVVEAPSGDESFERIGWTDAFSRGAVMGRATQAGAKMIKPAQPTFWGGYAAYLLDPKVATSFSARSTICLTDHPL